MIRVNGRVFRKEGRRWRSAQTGRFVGYLKALHGGER